MYFYSAAIIQRSTRSFLYYIIFIFINIIPLESITKKYGSEEANVRMHIANKLKNAPYLQGGPGAGRKNL